MEATNRTIISVSDLNRDARRLLENEFPMLWVEGEISNFAAPASGHWYFTLKDDKAQVRCAMFRNRNMRIRFKPKNGQQVIVRGRISLYEGRGEFQMIAENLEDAGDGALRRAFDQLKASLQAEGLFDESRKKPIPTMPKHIAIVTSPTGAAIRDVITVMQRRFPAIHLSIIPVQVQGNESAGQIAAALQFANAFEDDPFDLILLTRGGGSLEDLWSFNTEPVARAIAASELPVVCAVGHESDVSIADFIADLRAPTPSAAAELVTPDGDAFEYELDRRATQLTSLMQQKLQTGMRETTHLTRRLRHPSQRLEEYHQKADDFDRRLNQSMQRGLSTLTARLAATRLTSPAGRVEDRQQRIAHLLTRMNARANQQLQTKSHQFNQATAKLNTLSPLATLQRGYSIVTTEPEGRVVTDSQELKTGDRIRARLQSGELIAEVKETQ